MFNIQNSFNKILEGGMLYLPKILTAFITLIIGLWIINIIVNVFKKTAKRRKLDESLRHFLVSLIGILLKTMLFISVIGMLGVQMTSFIAVLGAAGLAVGLALQGSLSNFAGGVLILIFKPFVVGDLIEAQGFLGSVKRIEVFNTILNTLDNKVVIVPNGILSNGTISNYTQEKIRRVDMTFGIGYDDDIKKANKVLMDIVTKHKKVLKNPEPLVRVSELGDSSVNFTVRPWTDTANYWDVYFDITEEVKLRFDKEKISIPYPQTDVHLKKN